MAKAYYTDREVHLVGEAFQRAGTGTARPGAKQQYLARDSAVDAALIQLDPAADHHGAMNDGAALAHSLSKFPDAEEASQIAAELATHSGDPFFAAGFYNSVSAAQIAQLMSQDGNIRALAGAYASGVLSSSAAARVVQVLGWIQGDASPQHFHITAAQQRSLLVALTADPQAAANFTRDLTAPQIRKLFYGEAAGLSPAFRIDLVTLLTAGMRQINDPAQAQATMRHISGGLFADDAPKFGANDVKQLLTPLMALYSAGVAHSMKLPDGTVPRDWAAAYGKTVGGELAPLLRAMNAVDTNPKNALIKNMLQGGYVNVLFMPLAVLQPEAIGGPLAFNAAVGALQSLASSQDPLKVRVDRLIPSGTHADTAAMNDMIAGGAKSLMISSMVSHGLLYEKGHSTPLRFTGDSQKDSELVKAILDPKNQYKYHTKASSKEPVAYVRDLKDAYDPAELEEALRSLGSPTYEVK